jgi:hypothetical protein
MTLFNLPVTPQNVWFLIYVGMNRLRIRYSANRYPTSDPYISGDGFRALAHHIYDGETSFNPAEVKKKDIVFVSLTVLDAYFEAIHPRIQNPYILITHNGDTEITLKYKKYLNATLIHWFSQNVLFKHPKLTPIPIGLENISYFNHGIVSFIREQESKKRKKNKILYGFSISTNPKERSKALHYLQSLPVADEITKRLNSHQYFQLLSEYKFVASPPGNGEDCIRTWEAMYVGVIPIVQRSILTTYFESLKLPLWVIDSWDELEGYSERDLEKTYQFIMKKCDRTALFLQFWKHKIGRAYGK